MSDQSVETRIALIQQMTEVQTEDIAEIKEAVQSWRAGCEARHTPIADEMAGIKEEIGKLAVKQKGIVWGLGTILTGMVLAFFEWLFSWTRT